VKEILASAGIARAQTSVTKGAAARICGIPLSLVQRWLGHSNIAMTAIYTAVMGDEERDLAERL
jgi:integrase